MEADIARILRAYPFMDTALQNKANRWLKKRGYDPKAKPNREQNYLVPSPPGRGNLVRIPMFLDRLGASGQGLGYYNNSIITDAGAGVAARNNNVTLLNITTAQEPVLNQYNSAISQDQVFGHFVVSGMTFSTRQTPWVKMRVVGIETLLTYTPAQPLLPNASDVGSSVPLGVGYACPPRILLRNFRVAGSANLFLQDDYIDGTFFSVKRFAFGGLRAFPLLESPKTLKIDIAISGEHYHGSAAALGTQLYLQQDDATVPSATNVTFSVNAVVDIRDDTSYGKNKGGPYQRGLNIVRTPPKDGQAFLIGE